MTALKKWKWNRKNPFNPETATPEELAEYIAASEEMIVQCRDATERVRALLDNKELWEDLTVLSLELNDATEDLNDQIRDIEVGLQARRVRPGWVPMTYMREGKWWRAPPTAITGALIWNGKNLIWEPDDPQFSGGLILESPRGVRAAMCSYLNPLWDELNRSRCSLLANGHP